MAFTKLNGLKNIALIFLCIPCARWSLNKTNSFVLKFSGLTMLCWLQVHSKAIHLYTYSVIYSVKNIYIFSDPVICKIYSHNTYILVCRFLSIIGYYKILDTEYSPLCYSHHVVHYIPRTYFYNFKCASVYLLIPLSITHPPPFVFF